MVVEELYGGIYVLKICRPVHPPWPPPYTVYTRLQPDEQTTGNTTSHLQRCFESYQALRVGGDIVSMLADVS